MSFVAAAATVGGWVGLTGTAAVIGGGAMIGAGVGGTYSALTGDGKILDSMLTGAGIGGLAGWGLGAAGVGGAAAGTAGSAVPGAGIAGGATTAAETAAVASNTPAIAAASNINPATGLSWEATGSGLSAGAGSPVDPSWWSGLSGMEKLGVGLGATSLLGMLGAQQQEGIATQGDKGMIRPYEYSTAKREPEAGESYYFQPIEYDKYGKTTKPLDTSERNYFTQKFTEMPAYAAANGGQVPPNLDHMPPGGLASIQGMRDGYGAQQTMDGNIPQFADGGYTYNPETKKYTEVAPSTSSAISSLPFPMDSFNQLRMSRGRHQFLEPERYQEDQDWANALLNLQKMPRRGFAGGISDSVINPKQEAAQGSGYAYDPANQRYNEIAPQVAEAPRRRSMFDLLLSGVRGDEAPQSFGNPMTDPFAYDMGRQFSHLFSGLKIPQAEQQVANRYKYAPIAQQYQNYASGGITDGHLGGYSDGGHLLKGPGDGVSDSIPASINDKQPARLADGEFVIPARIVSELGNGSTDAGAKRLYGMMDRIQADRSKTVGKGKVAVDSKARKHLPA